MNTARGKILRLFLIICAVYKTVWGNQSILFMQNFEPHRWSYVCVNEDKIKELAIEMSHDPQLRLPCWAKAMPSDLTLEESVNYLLGFVSIDFCHWGLKKTSTGLSIFDFYAKDEEGNSVRGSLAMTELVKRAYRKGVKLFEAPYMQTVTVDQLRSHLMGFDAVGNEVEIPMLEERVRILNELGTILLTKWGGTFYQVFLAAEGRVLNQGNGLIEILVRDFPRYRDEYFYKGKKIGIYKLAQLSVFALQNATELFSEKNISLFSDCDVLTICADYQIPKCLRALGILEYDLLLEELIQKQQCIPAGSDVEIELRMATVYAGWLLKEEINKMRCNRGDSLITSQELDHLLWFHGRQSKEHKHHLTITTMY